MAEQGGDRKPRMSGENPLMAAAIAKIKVCRLPRNLQRFTNGTVWTHLGPNAYAPVCCTPTSPCLNFCPATSTDSGHRVRIVSQQKATVCSLDQSSDAAILRTEGWKDAETSEKT